jgi:hypothetical protein
MMLPELRVPAFARIDEYAGLWAMESTHFDQLWAMLRHVDWAAHMSSPCWASLMKQRSSVGGTSTIQRGGTSASGGRPERRAILLGVESPGRHRRRAPTTWRTTSAARKASRSGRTWTTWPLGGLLGRVAGEKIYANSPTALIGSIGTMMTVYDRRPRRSGRRQGHVFKTGPLKGAGVPGSAVTEEQQAHFQGIVNGMQVHFDAAVRKGRGLSGPARPVRTGRRLEGGRGAGPS